MWNKKVLWNILAASFNATEKKVEEKKLRGVEKKILKQLSVFLNLI